MRRLALAAAVTLSCGAATLAGAQEAPTGIARWVPPAPDARHVFVMDSAHVLSDAGVRMLQDSSRALQAETGADVVWVTLPSLGGRAIEEAALYVGRTWKAASAGEPGDQLHNRGLVVLYVPDKRTVAGGANLRVEVARGLEGTITDSRSRRITAAMRDSLKAKRFDGAYAMGFAAAAALVRQDLADRRRATESVVGEMSRGPQVAAPAPVPTRSPAKPLLVGLLVAALLVALLFILTRALRRRLPDAGSGTDDADRPSGPDAGDAASMLAALVALSESTRRRGSSADFGSSSGFDFGGGGSDGGGGGGSDGGSLGGGDGYSGGGSSDSV